MIVILLTGFLLLLTAQDFGMVAGNLGGAPIPWVVAHTSAGLSEALDRKRKQSDQAGLLYC